MSPPSQVDGIELDANAARALSGSSSRGASRSRTAYPADPTNKLLKQHAADVLDGVALDANGAAPAPGTSLSMLLTNPSCARQHAWQTQPLGPLPPSCSSSNLKLQPRAVESDPCAPSSRRDPQRRRRSIPSVAAEAATKGTMRAKSHLEEASRPPISGKHCLRRASRSSTLRGGHHPILGL